MDDRTLVDILRDRAQLSGDKIAYRFLVDGDKEELTLTYGQLHQRALAIASRLKAEAKPGDRALLLYPPGLEFICAFFGCLYAGVIAVPAYPPGKSRLVQNVKRLELLSRNCTPAVLLCDDYIRDVLIDKITDETEQSVLAQIEHNTSQDNSSLALCKAKVVSTTSINDSVSESIIITPSLHDLAFLQYTSGSTGNPKGVMVSHGNSVTNSAQLKITHHQTEDSVVTSWLPQYHDMGLIGAFFQSIYTGCLSIIFSPSAFIKKPLSWLRFIYRNQSSCSGAPNFAYQLCVDSFSEEKMHGVDLSCWEVAYSGAEPIQKNTMEKFIETYEPYGFNPNAFFPVYGMAEHTLIVSAGILAESYKSIEVDKDALSVNEVVEDCKSDQGQTLVGCGTQLESHCVAIVDPETKHMLQGAHVGEIWCQGLSVAQGYWDNEAATKETFHAYTKNGQGPFLRTGDLGFMKDGELYIVGRLKDMIIIRGRNYAPQDVEYAVEAAHEGIRKGCVAAFGFEKEGIEKLAVVCEVKRTFVKKDHDEIIQAIIKNITRENELSVSAIVLLKPGQIFKTTSGKIQRRKTKQAYLNSDLNVLFSWHAPDDHALDVPSELPTSQEAIEQQLKSWLASRLGLNEENINRESAFMDLNLDSIATVEASEMLSSWLGHEINPAIFWEHASIASLSSTLGKNLTIDENVGNSYRSMDFEAIKKRLAILRFGLKLILSLKSDTKLTGLQEVDLSKNYIIVSNHSSIIDNLLSLSILPNTIALATSSLFYRHFTGKIMRSCGFIFKEKNTSDPAAIQSLLAAVKAGFNVYIAPEGQLSWDGQLQTFRPGLGALLKLVKKPVLVVRYHNGFRHSPRWARKHRKTKVLCEIQEPLEIDESMSNTQLDNLIRERLSFETKPELKFESRSKCFAEGLENPVWICPSCKSIDSLSSKHSLLTCSHCLARWTIDQDANLIDKTANQSWSLSAVIKQVERAAHEKFLSGELRKLRSKNTVKLYRYSHGKLKCEAKGVLYIDDNFIGIEGKYSLQLDFSGVENVNLDMSKRLHIKHNGVYYEFCFAENESACKWQYLLNNAKSSVGLLVKEEVCNE